MATQRRGTQKTGTEKKREGVIVRPGSQPIAVQESKKLGLKWKANGPMTAAGKVKEASGAKAEETAGVRRSSRARAKERSEEAGTTQAQTAGMGNGRRDLLKKPRIQTAVSGPTSRAEPRAKSTQRTSTGRTTRRPS